MGIYHNSRLPQYRSPLGAVKCATNITLWADILGECSVVLRLWSREGERLLEGERHGDKIEFCFDAPDTPDAIFYRFVVTENGCTYSYSSKTGEGRQASEPFDIDYQITVYSPSLSTPNWFKRAIVYQIFPDRFSRGGRLGGLVNIHRHTNLGRRVYIHRRWNEEVVYKPFPGDEFYEPCDFFGGDLYGVASKTEYLRSLNVSCVYFNPIFESSSNHRYNTGDYERIDPVLGGEDALAAMKAAFDSASIRVMLDGVFSHTGDDSVYFNRYGRYDSVGAYNSRDSKYASWYDFLDYPEEYRAWWGFRSLPEICETDASYIEFVRGILTKYAQMGFTAWRLDVADELPDEFIVMLREHLKRIDKNALLLGEVWENASSKISMGARRGYVNGDELDSVMNYPFRDALFDFLLGKANAFELLEALFQLLETYPLEIYMSLLNLIGSHDTVRALTALSGAPHRDALTRDQAHDFCPDENEAAFGRRRLMLAAMVQFFMPGVPSIYYGDEAGMTGMADPFNRATYPWGNEDMEILLHYRAISDIRAHSETLMRGSVSFAAADEDVFAVMREYDGEYMLLVINRASEARRVDFAEDAFKEGIFGERMDIGGTWRTVYAFDESAISSVDGKFFIAAHSGAIMKKAGVKL